MQVCEGRSRLFLLDKEARDLEIAVTPKRGTPDGRTDTMVFKLEHRRESGVTVCVKQRGLFSLCLEVTQKCRGKREKEQCRLMAETAE